MAFRLLFLVVPAALGAVLSALALRAAELPAAVRASEEERIAVIAKVKPAVAAVCFFGGKVCGSGVVISDDGYCLTNFHVAGSPGMSPVMQCGLANGQLYDTVIVGQDKVGDVALVKLLPKKPGDKFPFVALGDSDKVEAGDWSIAMGNPFGLAIDFTPTVTFGLVSGVNRYQPPEGKGTLEYTDCIQIDTSINPGNSGGPLFNMKGELIGINGRGSFEKRGRVNSGVGYAISINQIKNFLGHMRVGLDTDHATLGASVVTESEDGELNKMVFDDILDDADAAHRGLKVRDQLYRFAGRPMSSNNQYKNVLGIYPADWKLPLVYRRGTSSKEILVRLMGNMDKAKEEEEGKKDQPPGPPRPQPGGQPPNPGAEAAKKSQANKLFAAKKGFANFHFNKVATERLIADFTKATGDFTGMGGAWNWEGSIQLAERSGALKISWTEDKDNFTEVKMMRDAIEDRMQMSANVTGIELAMPQGSGGFLASMFLYRNLLIKRAEGFSLNENVQPGFVHGGVEPFYPPSIEGKMPADLGSARVDCEVLRTRKAGSETKWYFDPKDHTLLGFENWHTKTEDPCEVFFYDYKDGGGVKLPHRIVVRYADKTFATIALKSFSQGKK